jgi:hypothetical protein
LNCWVTETKHALFASRISTILAKSASDRVVDDDGVDPARRDVGQQLPQSGSIHRRAGEPAVVVSLGQAHPALVSLAVDESLTGLALRLQRIEFLFEPLLGGFAGVDRAANPFVPPSAAAD